MADDKNKEYKYDDLLAPQERGNKVDEEAADRAAEAGVKAPEYVDYEEALQNYESRPDVETLEERRARENGTSFGSAAFRREAGNDSAVTTTDDVAPKAAEAKVEAKKADDKK
jgi:hypothetical protein